MVTVPLVLRQPVARMSVLDAVRESVRHFGDGVRDPVADLFADRLDRFGLLQILDRGVLRAGRSLLVLDVGDVAVCVSVAHQRGRRLRVRFHVVDVLVHHAPEVLLNRRRVRVAVHLKQITCHTRSFFCVRTENVRWWDDQCCPWPSASAKRLAWRFPIAFGMLWRCRPVVPFRIATSNSPAG